MCENAVCAPSQINCFSISWVGEERVERRALLFAFFCFMMWSFSFVLGVERRASLRTHFCLCVKKEECACCVWGMGARVAQKENKEATSCWWVESSRASSSKPSFVPYECLFHSFRSQPRTQQEHRHKAHKFTSYPSKAGPVFKGCACRK